MTVREFAKAALSNDFIGFVDDVMRGEPEEVIPAYKLLMLDDPNILDREVARFTYAACPGYNRDVLYVQLVNEETFQFQSGMEMYEYLTTGRDLYSKKLDTYIFEYNDAGALCYYNLSPSEVQKILKEREEGDGEYWGAYLGPGGYVLDDSDYDDEEHRYASDWELKKRYLRPSLEFCEEMYNAADDWTDTENVTWKTFEEEKRAPKIYAVWSELQDERLDLSDMEFFSDEASAVAEFNIRKNHLVSTGEWKLSSEFSGEDITASDNSVLFECLGVELYINIETISVK